MSRPLFQMSTQRPRRSSNWSKVTRVEEIAMDYSQTCAVPQDVIIPIQQMEKLRSMEV